MTPPHPTRKIALLVGNGAYEDSRLAELAVPLKDVEALGAALAAPEIGGFEVATLLDAPKHEIEGAIEDLFADRGRHDLVVLYFSGHGLLDRDGELYLALARSRQERLLSTALPAAFLRRAMDRSTSRRQVIVLDCCHAGAFSQGTKDGAGDGIGRPAVTEATFDPKGYGRVALLSSTATQLSWEGDKLIGDTDRSLFTHFLVEGLATGAAAPERELLSVGDLYRYAHDRVVDCQPDQTPQWWTADPATGELILARNPAWRADPAALLPADLLEDLAADRHRTRLGAVHDLERLMADGTLAAAAAAVLRERLRVERDYLVRERIEAALGGAAAPVSRPIPEPSAASPSGGAGGLGVSCVDRAPGPQAAAPSEALGGPAIARAEPEPRSVFRDRLKDGREGPEMMWLPRGRFLMGSPDSDDLAFDHEKPQHKAVIARPFAIGRFPVTFEEYDRFCAATGRDKPSDQGWGRGRRPAMNVSWNDAVDYCVWLSGETGRAYRLPSEAEWEYACRAGTTTRFCFGDDPGVLGKYACFNGNSGGKTHPVGDKRPNPWGLYDLHGNVWEWVQDTAYSDYRTAPSDGSPWEDRAGAVRAIHGGSWLVSARYCRCACRGWVGPGIPGNDLGFRCARGPE